MTTYVIYAVNKTLLHNDYENPKAIVTHHPLFDKPYSVEFVNHGGIMYHRFIIAIRGNTSLYTTSKFFRSNIVFQNNLQYIFKVLKPKDILYGIRTITVGYLQQHTTTKKRHYASSLSRLFHPRKYLVGIDENSITPFMLLNLSTCK